MNKYEIKIKKLEEEIDKLKNLIVKDPLTCVLNRRGIDAEFKILFDEAYYFKKHPNSKRRFRIEDFSLVLVDCDDFKEINDTYGHAVGDIVLKKVAGVFKTRTRNIDLVGRLGGEEFIIALFGVSEEQACEKAEILRESIKKIKIDKHPEFKITASFGVSSIKKSEPKNLKEFAVFADEAMYEAKYGRGKDCVVKYSDLEIADQKGGFFAKGWVKLGNFLIKLTVTIIIFLYSAIVAIVFTIFESLLYLPSKLKEKFDNSVRKLGL